MWSLIKTERKTTAIPAFKETQLEYHSPWARVKLVQSAICDLHKQLNITNIPAQSNFENTKSLFQKNIFNDEVLRELKKNYSEKNVGYEGISFTSIDTGRERIFVCTNQNFILACSKSLKTERFQRILINNSKFLFPSTMRLLNNEDFIAIGLSNGSVMILNCSRNTKDIQDTKVISSTRKKSSEHKRTNLTSNSKSCAIQNIILNERRLPESSIEYPRQFYNSDSNSTLKSSPENQFEMKIFDQEILLSGSVLQKGLIKSLEISCDSRKLFALSEGRVRTYDFSSQKEIGDMNIGDRVSGITVAKDDSDVEQFLVTIRNDDEVSLHFLK